MYERPLMREMYVTDLTLSKKNPRFPKPVESEAEAILSFFKLKKVGPKKLEALIQDIIETGTVLQDFIVLQEGNEYVVHDGNRRLTALKLLLDDTVELIKDVYPKTYQFIETVKQNIDVNNLILSAKVYTDPEAMANHVMKIHSGEQSGAGQINWDSNEKDTFSSLFLNKKPNIGNSIYKRLENNPDMKYLYDKIKDNSYATTFDRIFSFSDIRTKIFKLDRGKKVDLDNDEHFSKVCGMIDFFISQDATVADVYTKDLANNFFNNVSPIVSSEGFSSNGKIGSESNSLTTYQSSIMDPDESSTMYNSEKKVTENIPYSLNLKLKLNKKVVNLYNDFDLTELIETATDSNGENLKRKVFFHSDSKFVKDNIFSGDAPIGVHFVQVKLDNYGKSVSKSIEIIVDIPKKTIQTTQPKNEFFKSIAVFTDGEVQININNTVNMLISEIQSINNGQDYRYMIASSVRQLLELSIDKVIKDKELRNHGNPKQNLKFLIEILTDRILLSQVCNGDNKLRYQATKNFLGAIESDKLYDYLNLITHDSYATDYFDLVEKINKSVTPILVVFHNYLQLD